MDCQTEKLSGYLDIINPELTTRCSQLKMTAADGKRYLTDCMSQQDIPEGYFTFPSGLTGRPKVALPQV